MTQMNAKSALELAKNYHAKGDLKQAEQVYSAVLQVDPHNAEAMHNLGLIYASKGMLEDAVAAMKKSIELDRGNPAFHNNLGEIYRKIGQMEHAEFHLSAATELNPNYSDAYSNLGLVYKHKGDIDSAKLCFANALQTNPNNIAALINTGNLLRENREFADAVECYEAVLSISPDNPTALTTASMAYYELGEYNAAAKYISRLIQNRPELHVERVNLGLITLRNKDFRKGFQLYESRFKYLGTMEGDQETLWRGTGQNDKVLYVYNEKQGLSGFGDTIMFARYVSELEKSSPSKIVFRVQPELVSLLQNSMPEIVEVTAESCTEYAKHSPLVSLPLVLNARAKTIPSTDGYIKADSEKSAAMAKIMKTEKKKIGIACQTSRQHINYAERSIDPNSFAPILADESVQLFYISTENPDAPMDKSIIDMREHINDFADTAAIIDNLDMVITADTSVVHLAGAMGKKTCLLLNRLHDWRWFNAKTGKVSEWYSSVTFYVKDEGASWIDVVSSINYNNFKR